MENYFAITYTMDSKEVKQRRESEFLEAIDSAMGGHGSDEPDAMLMEELDLKITRGKEVIWKRGRKMGAYLVRAESAAIYAADSDEWADALYLYAKDTSKALGKAVHLHRCTAHMENGGSQFVLIEFAELSQKEREEPEAANQKDLVEMTLEQPDCCTAEPQITNLGQCSNGNSMIGPVLRTENWDRFYDTLRTFWARNKLYLFGHERQGAKWFISEYVPSDHKFKYVVTPTNWARYYHIDLFQSMGSVGFFGQAENCRWFISFFNPRPQTFDREENYGFWSRYYGNIKIFSHNNKLYMFGQSETTKRWFISEYFKNRITFYYEVSSGDWYNYYDSVEIFSMNQNTYMVAKSTAAQRFFISVLEEKDGNPNFEHEVYSSGTVYDLQEVFHNGDNIYLFRQSAQTYEWNISGFNTQNNNFEEVVSQGTFDRFYDTIVFSRGEGHLFINGQSKKDNKWFIAEVNTGHLTYQTENWMECLAPVIGDKDLRHVKIPATHNSGSFTGGWGLAVQCQSHNIGEQLLFGVRSFDIRLTGNNGKVYMHHNGYWYEEQNFEYACLQIKEFISKHKKEFVILNLSTGNSSKLTDHDIDLIHRLVSRNLGPYMFKNNTENRRIWNEDLKLNRIVRNAEDSTNQIMVNIWSLAALEEGKYKESQNYWHKVMIGTWNADVYRGSGDSEKQAERVEQCVYDSLASTSGNMKISDCYFYNLWCENWYTGRRGQGVFDNLVKYINPERINNINLVSFDDLHKSTALTVIDLNQKTMVAHTND